jgi:predicted small secreted protein
LIFEAEEYIEIPVGAYCEFEGQTYTLLKPENFKKQGTRKYNYTLTLEGPQGVLRKYKMRDKVDKQLKFSLTAKPHEHLQLLIDNLNERETGWAVGEYIDAPEKVISYNHTSLDAALQQIAEAFDTEWEIQGQTIHLRKVEYNKTNPLALSYGKGNGFRPGVGRANTDETSAIEILFVQGGERNINWSQYGSRELRLPKSASMTFEGRQYITDAAGLSVRRGDKALTTATEDSLDCSHIYPSRVGEVSGVEAVNPDNNAYDFFDSSIPEDLDFKACLIAGQSLTVKFETGILAGREFDVDYKHAERRFLLIAQDVDGVTMPNETFKPAIGDKYAVFGMQMPEPYICDDTTQTGASWDMFREAVKYLYEHENPRFSFSGELDGIWAKQNWLNVGGKIVLGGYVNFSDPDFQPNGINIRIVGIRDAVNNPYSPVIELSNAPAGVSIASELKKIKQNEVVVDDKVGEVYAYAKRRYRETLETVEMLEGAVSGFSDGVSPLSVQTMSLIVGSEALQFRFVDSAEDPAGISHSVTFDPATKIMTAAAGIIQHMTIGITTLKAGGHETTEYSFWDVAAFDSPPLTDPAKKYYLYIKASKAESTAVFYLSETPIKMEELAGYYHFLVGFLNSEIEGERSFARMHGFTEILPGRISASKIHADTVEVTEVLAEQVYATGVQIDGNLLVKKTVDAEKIDVTGLFADEITATNFNLGRGKVGGFDVDSVLKSENDQGQGIFIDPQERLITIEDKAEGAGISAVRMRGGALTPQAEIDGAASGTYETSVISAPYDIYRNSNELRAGVFKTLYFGKYSASQGLVKDTEPAGTERYDMVAEKNYAADFCFLLSIVHSGDTRLDKLDKLQGNLSVSVTSKLTGVRADGTKRTLVPARTQTIEIERSDQQLLTTHPITRKSNFSNPDCIASFWEVTLNFLGDLTYQERYKDWTFGEYWNTNTGLDIHFEVAVNKAHSFYPSLGVTELTTSGFQTIWAQNRYFRIDGEADGVDDIFIDSAGTWHHNGEFVLNGAEIVTLDNVSSAIASDLSAYATKQYVQEGFVLKSEAENFAKLNSDNVFQGNVTIQGNLIQEGSTYETHAEQVYTSNDFITLRDGALSALGSNISGLKVLKADGVNNLILGVGNDAISRIGWENDTLQAIATREDNPISNGIAVWNSANSRFETPLSTSQFLRSDVDDTAWGIYTFSNNNIVPLKIIRNNTDTNSGGIRFGNNSQAYDLIGNADRVGLRLADSPDYLMHWDVNGNVGIGTTSPSEKLDTKGNGLFENEDGNINVSVADTRYPPNKHKSKLFPATLHFSRWSGGSAQNNWTISNHNDTLQIKFGQFDNGDFDSIGVEKIIFNKDGDIIVSRKGLFGSDISTSSTFISGFAGSGWKLDAATNHLTVDNLTVRNQMDVYELVINKIRATNGSLWVSDALKITATQLVDSGARYRLFFDNDSSNKTAPFSLYDIVKAQNFDGRNVKVFVGKIDRFDSGVPVVYPLEGTPWDGMEIVRIGNTSDTNRQGAIYLTSSDNGAPYIDVLDGVTSADYSGNNRLRIGKLDGISGQNGYGIWGSRNGNDTDFVISSDGYAKIAGWNFDNEYLWSGNKYGSGAGIELRSGGYKRLITFNDSDNYVNHFYNSSTSWGLSGKYNGNVIFQLGSTNRIAGWNFDNKYLWNGNKFGSGAGIELQGGTHKRLITHSDSNNWVNHYYYSSSDWGLRGRKNGSDIFQLGSTNQIAGVNFDNSRLWTTNWELKADGTATFTKGNIGGFTIDSDSLSTTGVNGKILVEQDGGRFLRINESTSAPVLYVRSDNGDGIRIYTEGYSGVGLSGVGQTGSTLVDLYGNMNFTARSSESINFNGEVNLEHSSIGRLILNPYKSSYISASSTYPTTIDTSKYGSALVRYYNGSGYITLTDGVDGQIFVVVAIDDSRSVYVGNTIHGDWYGLSGGSILVLMWVSSLYNSTKSGWIRVSAVDNNW